VDFFYITNANVPKVFRPPPNMTINEHLNKQGFVNATKFNEDHLSELKMRLMNSEESTRYQYPDKTAALDGYFNLAEKFYQEYNDFIVGAYFYKRVIEIAKQNNVSRNDTLRKNNSRARVNWDSASATTR
jgi:hypothetical protein